MLEDLLSSAPRFYPYILGLLYVIYLISRYFKHGLNKYPGPKWAKFTDLWRYIDVRGRRPEVTHIALHKKHGDIVRLGPNVLSFANPKAIRAIYGLNKGFVKVGDAANYHHFHLMFLRLMLRPSRNSISSRCRPSRGSISLHSSPP